MSKHHRFTGRELSSLLEQVREELGAEAAILEANKIRTGGVAGFFKTEQFEVVAARGGSNIEIEDDGSVRTLHLDLIEPDGSPAAGVLTGGSAHRETDRIDLSTAIDRARAERFQDVPDTLDIRTPLPSTSPAHEPDRSPTFLSDLPAAPPERSVSPGFDATPPNEAIPSYFDTLAAREGQESATALLDRVQPVEPTSRSHFGDILAAELQQPEISIRSTETDDFWNQLERVDTSLPPLDVDSRIITILGNRAAALTVARRVEAGAVEVPPALAAISPTPDALGIPAWQVIDTVTELDDRLRFWNQAERTGIVIIDADLGEEATSMVERVRAAGSTVLRLTIDDELSPQRIHSLMRRLGGNVIIDLTFRPAPAYVLSLIDGGIPLATVDGRELDAGLVYSLRKAETHG